MLFVRATTFLNDFRIRIRFVIGKYIYTYREFTVSSCPRDTEWQRIEEENERGGMNSGCTLHNVKFVNYKDFLIEIKSKQCKFQQIFSYPLWKHSVHVINQLVFPDIIPFHFSRFLPELKTGLKTLTFGSHGQLLSANRRRWSSHLFLSNTRRVRDQMHMRHHSCTGTSMSLD